MKSIRTNNGIIHLVESKALCLYCGRKIPFEEIEEIFMSQDKFCIEIKCVCHKMIGITTNIKGDYVSFELVGDKPHK